MPDPAEVEKLGRWMRAEGTDLERGLAPPNYGVWGVIPRKFVKI